MKKQVLLGVALVLLGALAVQAASKEKAAAAPDHVMYKEKDIQWGEAPPALPAGAKVAVLMGDPGKPGPFILRIKAPSGYRVMPHWHPTTETVTVLSGTFNIGMGDKWDDKALTGLGSGGFITMNAKARHFAICKGETVVQVSGTGPFVINYVDPSDDPSKKMAAAPAKPAAKPKK